MKRFLVFAYYQYYPAGGWSDFRGSYDTLEEGIEAGKAADMDFWQVVDSTTGQEVA